MSDTTRRHHYELAHVALRSVAFRDPLGYLGVLASPDAKGFLASLVRQVVQAFEGSGEVIDFGVENLRVHLCRAAGHPCAIVEMPPPRATTEAFFVAAVLPLSPDPSSGELHYFTLEYSLAYGNPPETVLGEWTADGNHCNHGVGPEPRLESFQQAISALLIEGHYTPPRGGASAARPPECWVRLVDVGPNRVQVIALLRRCYGLSLAEAKTLIESEGPLVGTVPCSERDAFEAELRRAGASAIFVPVEPSALAAAEPCPCGSGAPFTRCHGAD